MKTGVKVAIALGALVAVGAVVAVALTNKERA